MLPSVPEVDSGSGSNSCSGKFTVDGILSSREAWKSVGQITKEDAMVKYVQLIKQLDPSFDPNSEVKNVPTKQGMGIAVSKMCSENEEEINEEAKTIFDWCKEGNSDKVNSMLSDDIEAAQQKDEQGLTLLHWACDRGHPEIVSILLKAGANVNAQDEELLTPLHYAATCEREDLVSILLEAGSDRSIKDDSGQTPSECADSISLRNLIDGYSSALT